MNIRQVSVRKRAVFSLFLLAVTWPIAIVVAAISAIKFDITEIKDMHDEYKITGKASLTAFKLGRELKKEESKS